MRLAFLKIKLFALAHSARQALYTRLCRFERVAYLKEHRLAIGSFRSINESHNDLP